MYCLKSTYLEIDDGVGPQIFKIYVNRYNSATDCSFDFAQLLYVCTL